MQLINILTLGNPDGTGVFFPNGLGGALTKPTGFDKAANGYKTFPTTTTVAGQVCLNNRPLQPLKPYISGCG